MLYLVSHAPCKKSEGNLDTSRSNKDFTHIELSHISAVSHQQYHTSTSGHYFFCLHGIFIDRTHNRGDMRTRVTKQKLSGRLLKNVVENSYGTDYMNAVLAAWFWAPSKSMHGACAHRERKQHTQKWHVAITGILTGWRRGTKQCTLYNNLMEKNDIFPPHMMTCSRRPVIMCMIYFLAFMRSNESGQRAIFERERMGYLLIYYHSCLKITRSRGLSSVREHTRARSLLMPRRWWGEDIYPRLRNGELHRQLSKAGRETRRHMQPGFSRMDGGRSQRTGSMRSYSTEKKEQRATSTQQRIKRAAAEGPKNYANDVYKGMGKNWILRSNRKRGTRPDRQKRGKTSKHTAPIKYMHKAGIYARNIAGRIYICSCEQIVQKTKKRGECYEWVHRMYPWKMRRNEKSFCLFVMGFSCMMDVRRMEGDVEKRKGGGGGRERLYG
ncbi:hypothetical protein VP01_89g1 [Puccinia sorghi]|uniref:Uncharacterized protein n=1 Tax=Puccinia sorghi TaxID=27349 RepID=A0A0L6U7S9_9BASI|nr:hypothetical protein VP01_89g1 [Puccinia sorghi]